MHLLMIIPCLAMGGAEWAFVRLANALADTPHRVTCYVPYICDSSPSLVEAMNPRVRVVNLPFMTSFLHRVIYKLSQKIPFIGLEQVMHSMILRVLHHQDAFDVVNPHLHSGTMIACTAFQHSSVPIIETDHGDYALIMKEDPSLNRLRLPQQRLDGMVCLSRPNEARIRSLSWKPGFRTAIIPNAAPQITPSAPQRDYQPFTFGLVSRGIADKGWAEALAAFRLLQTQVTTPMRLVFVGEGPEIQRLKKEVAPDESVVFAGHQSDPADWVSRFDVGLLPSCFTAESLPNVIIECQLQGKPVIATHIGGIPEMLEHQDRPCGILIPISPATGRADVPSLATAMQRLMQDSQFHSACTTTAHEASARYSPQSCAAAYSDFFTAVTHYSRHGTQ